MLALVLGLALSAPAEPSLRDKIGQLLVIGFRGTEIVDGAPILEDLRDRNLGGVILFNRDLPTGKPGRNMRDPEQLASLIEQLRAASRGPLLVAVDQEGGKVQRLRESFGITAKITAKRFGEIDRPRVTSRYAAKSARVLADLGFNMNLAPVVDLDLDNGNPVIGETGRSYGKSPAKVVRHALAVIRTHHRHGLLTAIKHFPGHGSSQDDPHSGLPDVTGRWSESELEPFRRILKSGSCDAVMTGHIMNASIDPQHPATLSRATIHGVLREQLGWDGVVLSDDMGMGAIRSRYDLRTAVALALNAGVDILVFANNSDYDPHLGARVVAIIEELVSAGEVSEATIDAAYARVQALKAKLR
jgi:beta-N-acetylhexosaminidase